MWPPSLLWGRHRHARPQRAVAPLVYQPAQAAAAAPAPPPASPAPSVEAAHRRPSQQQQAAAVQTSGFASNVVSTTKYNLLTFFPKNLYEQFTRAANFYFLIVLILQYIPPVEAWTPTLAYLPLAVVISASAIKEAIEDFGRRRADREMNNSPAWTLDQNGNFVKRKWSNVKVGDIVRVPKNTSFPADILFLSSNLGFKCFVETKSLDGETNLKSKIGLPELAHLTSTDAFQTARLSVLGESPQGDIYSFLGSVSLVDQTGTDIERPLSIDQLLLRGTVLKNTEYVIGLVLYTSVDTKIMLNAGKTPSKRSAIDKTMNHQVFVILGLLVIVCASCAIANYVTQSSTPKDAIWMVYPDNFAFAAFLSFWTFVIIYSNFLPISIYISFEIVKLFQAFFISMDENMYDDETDFYCLPRNWNISDELGQVEYLFSDKTGTLTENRMEFRSCYVGGKKYRNEIPKVKTIRSEAMKSLRKVFGEKISPELLDQHLYDIDLVNDVIKVSKQVQASGEGNTAPSAWSPLYLFGEAMSLCHSVQIDEKTLVFSSPSPDELALLNFARDLGFVFHGRGQSAVTVSLPGFSPAMYTVITELAFTSERRRMSTIVRRPSGKILLITKGADSVMIERFASKDEGGEAERIVQQFASEGLRTLCYAYRELEEQELAEWLKRYKQTELSMENRAEQLADLADEIERKLVFLGVTALEDRLQERVPQTIQLMRQAGIKVWMLTGDKQETAISVGLSCKLITSDSKRFIIDGKTREIVEQQLHDALAVTAPECFNPPLSKMEQRKQRIVYMIFPEKAVAPKSKAQTKDPTTVIIEGHAVAIIMVDETLRRWFALLGTACLSVICCRVAPKQKAQVVSMVQEHKPLSITLSIGDGANDVSMLQKAHIGVGIFGKEGRQAVNASDYAFSRFAFLQRLVLVHGHWNYVRSAHLALMIYYKNMVYVLPVLWFQMLCLYSGQTLFQYTYNMFYNLLFTSLAPIVSAFYDQDVPAKAILAHPELFYGGITHKYFNFRLYWFHIGVAVFQAVIVFLFPLYAFADGSTSNTPEGWSSNYLFELGTVVYFAIILNVNFYIALVTRSWPWFFQLTVLLSSGIFLPFLAIVGYGFSVASGIPIYLYHFEGGFLTQPAVYFVIALTIPVCQGLPLVLRYIRTTYYPTDSDIIREIYQERDRANPDNITVGDRVRALWAILTSENKPTGKIAQSTDTPQIHVTNVDGREIDDESGGDDDGGVEHIALKDTEPVPESGGSTSISCLLQPNSIDPNSSSMV